MSTPAEAIPVANAIPIVPSAPPATPNTIPQNGFFQPLSFTQYIRRFVQVFLGHFDTFLTITVVASLPVLAGYQWMQMEYWGSSVFFHYLLLPFSRLVAEGGAVTATALIYILDDIQQPIPWTKAIQTGFQKNIVERWMMQALFTNGAIGLLLSPLGIFAFASPLLLLEDANLVLSLFASTRLVYFYSPATTVTTVFFNFVLTPFLCWTQRKLLESILPPLKTSTGEEMEEGDGLWSKQQVYEIIALPLSACLWTILFLDIRIKRKEGLTREALALKMDVELPPSFAAHVH